MIGFMLDTTLFNRLVDSGMPPQRLPKPTYVTHVQYDELENTRDPVRRGLLVHAFVQSRAQYVATESAVWNVSKWDEAAWGEDDGLFERMRTALNDLNKTKVNNTQDVLIAETALRNGYVLVTDDGDLDTVMRQFGGEVISSNEYLHGEA